MQKDPKKIIILEQDPTRKDSLKTILSQDGYIIFSFDAIANCLDNLDQLDADLLLVGSLDGESMMPVINALMATHSRLPLLLMSEDEQLQHILEINQCDHVDLVDAAFDIVMFRRAVNGALKNNHAMKTTHFSSFLVGNSPPMKHIKQNLKLLSRLKESILIAGETGVGKEIAARAIHHAAGQDAASFIKIDASDLNGPNSLSLVSAFREIVPDMVNAEKMPENKNGNKWTLYLDEVGLLPDYLQAELLFVTETRNGYFKVLAGSSQDMEALVRAGHFRKDLFYRLNAFHMKIPALRYRKNDIPMLTDFFIYKYCREFDKVCQPVSTRLKEMFMQYNWPGNVRELQDVVKQTLLKGEHHIAFSKHQSQRLKHVSQGMVKHVSKNQIRQAWSQELNSIEQLTNEKEYLGQVGEKALKNISWDFTALVEKKVMKRALSFTNWNRKKAAVMLNISYKSMLNKIKEYKLA